MNTELELDEPTGDLKAVPLITNEQENRREYLIEWHFCQCYNETVEILAILPFTGARRPHST